MNRKIIKTWRDERKWKKWKERDGITLIALVVTLVILIILATITLNIVFNENGLIKQTENAKNMQDMEKERERLEIIKGQTAMENAGKVTVDLYIAELKKENITEDGEITDNGDGSKTVITDTGYSVLIKPNEPNDVIIEIEGTVGKLKARIVSVKAVQEGNKITVEVEAKRAEGAIYKYYYKTKNGEYPINPVAQGKNKVTCEITGVSDIEEHVIKVEIDNGNGAVSREVEPKVKDEDELAVAPKLSQGMTPVKWNGTNWEKTTKEDEEWYKYSKRSKKWANIVLGDATFNTIEGKEVLNEDKPYTQLIWIPRYAYKITSMYHMNGSSAGNIEVVFINNQNKDKNGNTYSETYPTYTEGVNGSMSDYVVHPAFNYGSNKLDGIWVGKYETSNTGCTQDASTGNVTYTGNEVMQIKAGVTSWRNIKVTDIYTTCVNMNKDKNVYGLNTSDSVVDPHMLKNSEWGAVAYLSKSKYGKEKEEVYINNNQNYITGIGGDAVAVGSSTATANTYNTAKGKKASTTGNIYGVYDMNGGANEYVAGYVANGNGSLTTYGSSLVNAPDKHKDVYSSTTSTGQATQAKDYALAIPANGKYGDAVYETSNNSSSGNSWYNDYSYFPYSRNPVFLRGSIYVDTSNAGVFSFNHSDGKAGYNYGFRVAVPVL